MTCGCGIDWDDAFANPPYIAGAADYPARWAQQAARFRAAHADAASEMTAGRAFDLFRPQGGARGLVVFVHGGFWRAFGRSDWSHLAAGGLARGYAVALPGYTLAPKARLPEMTAQIAAALTAAATEVAGPIHLAGHSAGGHLVTRMLCADVALAPAVRARLARVVSISGLHDLRPLRLTQLNDVLQLTEKSALAESVALQRPRDPVPVTAWVGGAERPEFLRQSALLAEAWGSQASLVVEPGRHHFDVIDGLRDPDSPLMTTLLG
ncbi:alpha/beta hydrolase [Marinovum sp.]|uniref:alpha/beta hydrolase n=1 Tax=Marinovum sp. TaxID=2024839 RepID=UPI002B266728|nr:alpha/beta fold hydrolase [Marinovum sp.]